MKIHPTALISEGAQLDLEVEIGPYCVISAGARLGAGCVLASHVVLEGEVILGARNRVGPGTVIGAEPQDLSFQRTTSSGVVIGDDNVWREHCTVHRGSAAGTQTRIGHRNFFMVGAHVAHNAVVGSDVVLANDSLLGGYVEVGDRTFIGGGSAFHQFVRIGRLAMLQGHSAFSKDVPPFVVGAGLNQICALNVVGLRRAGMSREEREEIKRAFKLVYGGANNLSQALAAAEQQEWTSLGREFFDFLRTSKRGAGAQRRRRRQASADAGEES